MILKTNAEKCREWRNANLEKCRARDKARRLKRLESERAKARAWAAANPERKRMLGKAHYLANKEKYKARASARYWTNTAARSKEAHTRYAANQELARARVAEWKRKNPSLVLASNRNRELKKREAVCGCCTPTDFIPFYKRARLLGMHVDHVRPLAKGGMHCVHNLQLLEPIANLRKSAQYREAS